MKYLTNKPSQTKKLGEKLAKEIIKKPPKNRAFIIALKGDLGGGKTTFLQGFAKGLGIKEKILSPTFVILKKFQIPIRVISCSNSCGFVYFYHIDCYRITKLKEILDLGFREIISNPKNIVAVEWADRVKKIIPKTAIWLKIDFINQKTRKIMIIPN